MRRRQAVNMDASWVDCRAATRMNANAEVTGPVPPLAYQALLATTRNASRRLLMPTLTSRHAEGATASYHAPSVGPASTVVSMREVAKRALDDDDPEVRKHAARLSSRHGP